MMTRDMFLLFLLVTILAGFVNGEIARDSDEIQEYVTHKEGRFIRIATTPNKIRIDSNKQVQEVRNIAVLVTNGFELLDAMGPYEALKEVQNRYYSSVDFKNRTLIENGSNSGIQCNGGKLDLQVVLATFGNETVVSSSGVTVQPQFDLSNVDNNTSNTNATKFNQFDLLVLGAGSVNESDATSMDYIRHHHDTGGSILTVCTGAEYVAMLGLLDHKTATTNSLFLERFRTNFPTTDWISLADNSQQRFVSSTPQITTTAGITAGIDGILHQIHDWCGREVAEATRECLEWPLPLENINKQKNTVGAVVGQEMDAKNTLEERTRLG